MAEVDEFLEAVLPPLTAADAALHNGDAGPRISLWSRKDPVTLFGAVLTGTGWPEIPPGLRKARLTIFELRVVRVRGDRSRRER